MDEARVHRMLGEVADLDRAAGDYEAEMVRTLGDPPRHALFLLDPAAAARLRGL